MLNKFDLIPGLDIHDALDAHLALRDRLGDLVEGESGEKPDPVTVSSDSKCVLGKWIHGRATLRYARLPEFGALRDAHAQFHYCAGNVLQVQQEGNQAAARALQNGALRHATGALGDELTNFCAAAARFAAAGRRRLADSSAGVSRAGMANRALWILLCAVGAAAVYRVFETGQLAAVRAARVGLSDLLVMLAVTVPAAYFLVVRPLLRSLDQLEQVDVDLHIANATIETLSPMLITDSNSMIIKVNQAFSDVTGFGADEVLGKTPRVLRSDKQDAAFFASMWQSILSTGSWHGAIWNMRKDGGEFLADLTITTIRGETGEPVAYVSRFTDLTEQRGAMLVAGADKATGSSAQARAEFLGHMGHELRTPMNAMLGYTDLALNETPDTTVRGYLAQVRESGRKLLGKIDDILDLSKIESGKLALERIAFDLPAVCTTACRTAIVLASIRNLSVESSIDGDIPASVLGDPARTAQILDILLGNAVKFTDRGTVSLSVKLHRLSQGMASIGIMVRDTGIGMDQAQISRLFVPFSEAEVSAGRRHGGAGLGLVIAKSLVEQMGGTLAVESLPGQGSNFHAVLMFPVPGEQVDRAATISADADVGLAGIQEGRYAGKRVLVAEDDEDNQGYIRLVLEMSGFEVDIAENGREAVRMVKERVGAYDLILMDIRMPEMGGLEATRIIRASYPMASLPIVALSANAFEEDRQHSLNAGMNEHLNKPLEIARLNRALEVVLG